MLGLKGMPEDEPPDPVRLIHPGLLPSPSKANQTVVGDNIDNIANNDRTASNFLPPVIVTPQANTSPPTVGLAPLVTNMPSLVDIKPLILGPEPIGNGTLFNINNDDDEDEGNALVIDECDQVSSQPHVDNKNKQEVALVIPLVKEAEKPARLELRETVTRPLLQELSSQPSTSSFVVSPMGWQPPTDLTGLVCPRQPLPTFVNSNNVIATDVVTVSSDSDSLNAGRCREYRKKRKRVLSESMRELAVIQAKNDRLRELYEYLNNKVKTLKRFYKESISTGKFKCLKGSCNQRKCITSCNSHNESLHPGPQYDSSTKSSLLK